MQNKKVVVDLINLLVRRLFRGNLQHIISIKTLALTVTLSRFPENHDEVTTRSLQSRPQIFKLASLKVMALKRLKSPKVLCLGKMSLFLFHFTRFKQKWILLKFNMKFSCSLMGFSLEFCGHLMFEQKTSLKGSQSRNEKLENSF